MAIHIHIYGQSGAHPRRPTVVIEGVAERRRREAREEAERASECDRRGGIWGVAAKSNRIGP